MKIVIVAHGFPPRETAGTEWHSYILAKELSKRHEVHVFSRGPGEDYLEYADDFDGIPVRRINAPISFVGWHPHVDDRVALSFSDFLENLKPDLIHVQHCIGLGMSTVEVAIERCIPTLLFLHDFYLMCNRIQLLRPDGQLCLGPSNQEYCMDCILASQPSLGKGEAREYGLSRYNYAQKILSMIDHIVVPSEFVKETFQANFPSIREITVSPLGLDLSFLKGYKKKDSKRLRFGYIGTIHVHKGLHLLIEAFGSLRQTDSELRIHGSGNPDYLNSLRQTALNENVLFLGPYEHQELAKLLSEIDVFVMPSVCHESFSITIREALAVGVPVLVSDARAQADAIVEGFNGLHFKCGDLNDLEEKLQRMVGNTDLLRKLIENAKNSPVRRIDEQAEELESLYGKLVQRARRGIRVNVEKTFPLGRPLTNLLWYVRNQERIERSLEAERTSLTEELNKARMALMQRETEIKGLQAQTKGLTEELDRARIDFANASAELSAIKRSFGYLFMRFYATRIDQLFPEGTRRGELRKTIAASLRILAKKA